MIDRHHILLIDDDPVDREAFHRAYQRISLDAHLTIVPSTNSILTDDDSAVRPRLTVSKPDLVLLEVKVDNLIQFEVIRAVKACPELRYTPLIVLSDWMNPDDIVQAYLMGANSCVTKPYALEDIASVLERIARYWLKVNSILNRQAS